MNLSRISAKSSLEMLKSFYNEGSYLFAHRSAELSKNLRKLDLIDPPLPLFDEEIATIKRRKRYTSRKNQIRMLNEVRTGIPEILINAEVPRFLDFKNYNKNMIRIKCHEFLLPVTIDSGLSGRPHFTYYMKKTGEQPSTMDYTTKHRGNKLEISESLLAPPIPPFISILIVSPRMGKMAFFSVTYKGSGAPTPMSILSKSNKQNFHWDKIKEEKKGKKLKMFVSLRDTSGEQLERKIQTVRFRRDQYLKNRKEKYENEALRSQMKLIGSRIRQIEYKKFTKIKKIRLQILRVLSAFKYLHILNSHLKGVKARQIRNFKMHQVGTTILSRWKLRRGSKFLTSKKISSFVHLSNLAQFSATFLRRSVYIESNIIVAKFIVKAMKSKLLYRLLQDYHFHSRLLLLLKLTY